MAASSEDITNSQQEKLIQFQDITRCEDLDTCKNILASHSWDLEKAVEDAFRLPSPTRTPTTEQSPALNQNFQAADYTLTQWRPRGWLGFGWYIIQWPASFFLRTLYDLMRFVISIVRRPAITARDAEGDVRKFVQEIRTTYGLTPQFLETTYNQALAKAKNDLRFLLVYLHNPSHEDTDNFCRHVLCSPEVIEWLNENMLVWGCSVQSPEGYKVSRTLREHTYPFMCVIVLRESRMTVVARMRGQFESADQLLSLLTTTKDDNQASLRTAQLEREERTFNQTLRQQQDEAYMESLRADQEKARKKREEEERKRLAEQEEAQRAADEARAVERREQEKLQLAQEVPEEPPAGFEGAIQIALRLPSGKRIDRRFLQDQSMKYLYYYVLCHAAAPDNFDIHTTYPRRLIPCRPTGSGSDPPTFRDFGLAKTESLMVTDLDA